MKIEFQPQEIPLKFELSVTAYFAVTQLNFGLISMIGTTGLPVKLLIFWMIWPATLLVGSLVIMGLETVLT